MYTSSELNVTGFVRLQALVGQLACGDRALFSRFYPATPTVGACGAQDDSSAEIRDLKTAVRG